MKLHRLLLSILSVAIILICIGASGLHADEAKKTDKKPEAKTAEKVEQQEAKPVADKEDGDKEADKKAEADKPAEEKESVEGEKADGEKAGEESKDEAEKAEEEKAPATIEVKAEELKVKLGVDGVFVPTNTKAVTVKGEQWTMFKVVEAVEHGSKVKKGDVLIQFEAEDYEEALAQRKRDLRLAEISMREAELSMEKTEKTYPLQVEATKKSKIYSDEDFADYWKTEHDLVIESAKRSLDSAKFRVEYAREEYEQLKKMYEEDDLTEETEEIVLVRTRRDLEDAEYSYKLAELRYEEMMEKALPRREESMKRDARIEDLDHKVTMATLPMNLEQSRLGFEKQKISHEKTLENFKKFEGDGKLLTVKAPCDGIVYYGQFKDGKWGGGATVAPKLQPGQVVPSSDAEIMTIVQPEPLQISGTFPEDKLFEMKDDLKAEIKVTAYPDLELDGEVVSFNSIPAADGLFKATIDVDTPEKCLVMPGMKGHADILLCDKDEAILLPSAAVKTEEEKGKEKSFVFVQLKDKKEPQKREVELGRKKDDKVEIVSGLKVGEKVLAKVPE